MFELLFDTAGGWMLYAAAGIGIAFFAIAILYVVGTFKELSVWWGLLFGAIAFFGAVIAHGYLGLFTWILAGLLFVDIGATMFVIGMFAMIAMMAFNMVMTEGKTLVR